MPFEHCCFVSYRHTQFDRGRALTDQIIGQLSGELELQVSESVYRDKDRLKGAEFYNQKLAAAICRSVCMVVLYWPPYFDRDHLFCAREFKAMERLERQRLRLLPTAERLNGLIVLLAVRGFEQIPAEIRKKRICHNLEPYALNANIRRNLAFQQHIIDIGRYIAGRCRVFSRLPSETFAGCGSFELPSEADVLSWVRRIAPPPSPFANRGSSQ